MGAEDQHRVVWEHRQAELWERIFQVTHDVVLLSESLDEGVGGVIIREAMVRSAMQVGRHLVRAHAASQREAFVGSLEESRLSAVETDYWLRLAFWLQQKEQVQQDLSSIINQYSAIVDMLQKFLRHAEGERDYVAKHGARRAVS